jgi:hypothetical protein
MEVLMGKPANVLKAMENKPPMTGNGKHTTYKIGDDWGMVSYCFNHIIIVDGWSENRG